MRAKGILIAIDGPSGSGKSTVSRDLARVLRGRILDTGAMYRSVAYYALKEKAQSQREFSAIGRRLRFTPSATGKRLLVDGENLGKKLRSQRVGQMASYVSQFRGVRRPLTLKQRQVGKSLSERFAVVVEGRDIGTVVFPGLKNKFFLTANPRVRARRRAAELREAGARKVSVARVLVENRIRDHQDSSRKIAPLRQARGAILVNTSAMTISEVVEFIRRRLRW